MVIVLVWLVVFMIIILGIGFPLVFLSSLKQVYLTEQATTVKLSAEYIREYFEDKKAVISVTSKMGFFQEKGLQSLQEARFRGIPATNAPEMRNFLQMILEKIPSLRFIAYLTADSVRPILIQPFSVQLDLTEAQYLRGYGYREWAQKTRESFETWDGRGAVSPYVSDAFVSQPGDVPAVSISIPVVDGDNKMIGILYANLILDTLSRYIGNLRYGKTGKVFLVDSKGHLLAHPDIAPGIGISGMNGVRMTQLRDYSGNPMVANALRGIYKPGIYLEPEAKKRVLSTYTTIEPLGWVLVLEQDLEEVYGGVRAYAYAIVFLVLVSLAVSSVAFVYISRETIETARKHNELVIISETDPLTGLLNRRSMPGRIGQLISDYKRWDQGFVVGMFDIDDFKQVNDTFGHPYGDAVLREIAIRTVSILRAEDFLFRWGGEEFLVVLRNCDVTRARGVAEKIRHIIGDSPITEGPTSLSITITVGLSQYNGGSIDDLINRADEALYTGKRNGKNMVVVSE
jgi:diguanylate cyclase (GGDEF)-like protein